MPSSPMRKTYSCEVKALDAEQGIYELMPSTESIDRDGDILLAVGAELDSFRKNAVVMWAHRYDEPPVAKALEIEPVIGQGLKATIQFAPAGVSERADQIHGLWRGGFLNAASVGFIPKSWTDRKGDDGEGQHGGRIYTQWELLEFSIVGIPSNADALRLGLKAVSDQLIKTPACRQEDETEDECRARKIPEIMRENPEMSQEQAVAMAISMCGEPCKSTPQAATKRGRVLSAVNEKRIRDASGLLGEVLKTLSGDTPDDDTPADGERDGRANGTITNSLSELGEAGEQALAEQMRILISTVREGLTHE